MIVYRHAMISARKERGLTQRALGELIDRKQPVISQWERGFRIPSLDRTKLAFVLGLKERDFS